MNNIIKFHSRHPSNINNKYEPVSVKEYMPDWYTKKEKYKKNKHTGLYELAFKNVGSSYSMGRVHTWKSCPAILDTFMSGYYLLTPCDVEIIKNDGGNTSSPYSVNLPEEWSKALSSYDTKTSGASHGGFCNVRGYEEGFPTPYGYEELHFRWFPNWSFQVPEGYTTLCTHPLNLNNLPFRTIGGFIDCSSEFVGPGNIPFFIEKNWHGLIPAGTPYMQVIPIKNESWSSETIHYSKEEMIDHFNKKEKLNQLIHINKYKQDYWLRKEYQ